MNSITVKDTFARDLSFALRCARQAADIICVQKSRTDVGRLRKTVRSCIEAGRNSRRTTEVPGVYVVPVKDVYYTLQTVCSLALSGCFAGLVFVLYNMLVACFPSVRLSPFQLLSPCRCAGLQTLCLLISFFFWLSALVSFAFRWPMPKIQSDAITQSPQAVCFSLRPFVYLAAVLACCGASFCHLSSGVTLVPPFSLRSVKLCQGKPCSALGLFTAGC